MKAIIELEPPVDCTEDQFTEWINWSLGISSEISLENPLIDYELNQDAYENIKIKFQ